MFPGGIAEEQGDGDYPNGGHGPLNSTIGPDNVPCLGSMYTGPVGKAGDPGYHVHVFIGMFYQGKEVALPDGIGFADPEADFTYQPDPTASPLPPPIMNYTQFATHCYYETHSHDASGMVHVESFIAPPGMFAGQYGTKYTFGDIMAVWGIPISATNWGPLNGAVSLYTSGQTHRGGPGTNGRVNSNTYTLFCSMCDPAVFSGIPLYSHEVFWVVIGPGNPTGSSLPNVQFDTEW